MCGGEFVGGEQVEGGHRLGRVCGECAEDAYQAVGDAVDRGGSESLGVVLEDQVEAAARLHDESQRIVHGVVESVAGDPDSSRRVGEVGFGRIVLEDHEAVEQVAAAGVPGEPMEFGQAEVLVVEQGGLLLLEAFEQLAQGRGGTPAETRGQRVDEQADHGFDAFDFGVAAGDRGAEHHVLPARRPADQQPPGRLDHGAERDPVFPRPAREAGGDVLAQLHTYLTGHRGSGDDRAGDQTGRLVDPGEGALPDLAGGILVPLPQPPQVDQVGRDLRQLRGGPVERHQLPVQDRQRPAVRDDVVEGQHEPALAGVDPHQRESDERRATEIERRGPLLRHHRLHRGSRDLTPGKFQPGGDDLHRQPIGAEPEAGAQRSMPFQQSLGGASQRRPVHRAGQLDDLLHDVGVRVRPVDQRVEEEALLERAQRQQFLHRHRVIALHAREFLVRQFHQWLDGLFDVDPVHRDRGQRGHRSMPEHVPGGQPEPGLASPDQQPDCGDAVPAEGEEVVVDRGRVHAEHLRVQPAEQLLTRIPRGTTGTQRPIVGSRKRRRVDLAARRDRNAIDRNESGRNHVVRQPFRGVCPQSPHQGGDITERRGSVGQPHGTIQPIGGEPGRRILSGPVRVLSGPLRSLSEFLRTLSGLLRILKWRLQILRGLLGEDRVEAAVVGVAGPGEDQPVTEPVGEGVQGFGVRAWYGRGRSAVVLDGGESRQVVGQPDVGDAGDPQVGRVGRETGFEGGEAAQGGPGDFGGVGRGGVAGWSVLRAGDEPGGGGVGRWSVLRSRSEPEGSGVARRSVLRAGGEPGRSGVAGWSVLRSRSEPGRGSRGEPGVTRRSVRRDGGETGGGGAEERVVAVAGEFVVVGAALDSDVGGEAGEGGEVVGVEEEFAFPGHRAVDGGAECLLVGGGSGPAGFDGGAEAVEQAEVADVADEQGSAGGQQGGRLADDVGQVVGAREILRDRVDHDRVEGTCGEPGHVMCGLGPEFDPVGQVEGQLGAQGVDGFGGEVGAPVGVACRGDAGQQEAAADADLQDAAGAELGDAGDGGVTPFAHLLDGDGQPVVHAVPAGEVLLVALGSGRLVEEFVQVLPGADLVARVAGVQGGHDVRGEAAVAGAVLADHDGGLVDGRVGAQHGFDLAGLDAETADLHLGVGPAEELQPPVLPPADQVPGPVEALPRLAEGVGDETFRGEAGPPEVTTGQARAAQVELPGDSGGNRLEPRVQHVRPGARVGDADGHDRSGSDVGVAEAEGGVGGGLGRAVGVEHHAAAGVPGDEFGRDAFGSGEQGGRRRQAYAVGHRVEQRRGEDHERDAVGVRVVGERGARDAAFGGDDDEASAGEQAQAEIPEGDVETGRGELQDPAVRADAEPFALGGDEFGDTGVGEHDALGAAGGAGGVDDVGGVPGTQRAAVGLGGIVGRAVLQLTQRLRRVEHQDGQPVHTRKLARHVRGRDQAGRRGVAEHVGDPVRGIVGVQRQVRGPGLQHGHLGHDQLGRPGYGERDDPLRPRPARDQRVREPVGPLVQLRVGEPGLLEDQSDLVRPQPHLRGEHVRPGERRHGMSGGVPVEQDPAPLFEAQQLQLPDRRLGSILPVGQQPGVVPEHVIDGGCLQQIWPALHLDLAGFDLQREIQHPEPSNAALARFQDKSGVSRRGRGDLGGQVGEGRFRGDAQVQGPAVLVDREIGAAAVTVQQGRIRCERFLPLRGTDELPTPELHRFLDTGHRRPSLPNCMNRPQSGPDPCRVLR
ncbi:hypothetical protein Aple_022340 [Acrocarpospora pleiomorpha]|uniref:Uncharacterized protein n=1 Tax=Acrocarpospora pleiomorpha TaxID=90975 RepID=A0A5M3XMD6_9ACTN|nr:hypothetical protein Aple_022340 [Acrocarpospora pleiomorpha]